ncbi:PREDICTED: prion-like-(Q/N-rich) domain-bearing protein 25 isoform X2 [Eufriesea mexicana]|uniref:prion-like-(Q/N-rich) domain-bearing protein 25 isoform X2 n=1 Tax=Eufriesea mexicana TaxID=516756 RepID=UPI00083BBB50|nr:PREDICTED: prion-like-(Q/N-rich) domain-bearing protein 25 isoform X2 [Eufriesea mexicana]
MAGLVNRPTMGGLALSIGLCFVVRSAVVVAHGQHEHLLRRQTLAKCRYDVDCMNNAYCWNQEACLCKDEYIVYKNRTHVECLKVANAIGDRCEVDIQCRVTFAPFSECRRNICQCSDGSHYVEGRCYESVGLGQACQTHRNCYIKDSYCVTGFCACTLKYHPNPRNDGCIPSAELDDECTNDYECVAENSRCSQQVCSCEAGHVLSKDGKRCLKARYSVGEPCHEDVQCQMFLKSTVCGPNGKCSCIDNFHQSGPVCLRDSLLNNRCQSHRECVTATHRHSNSTEVTSVDCVGGICMCAKDYIMTEFNECVGYSDNGAATAHSWQQILRILPFLFFASFSIL